MIVRILRISLVVAITIADCRAAWSWGMSGRDSAWKLRMSLRGHDFGDNVLDDAPNNRVIAHVTLIVVAQTTTVNIHPKITAAPAIKEKLGSTEWDGVHEEIRRRKRNDETCAKDYQLCPKSLGGGCCPNDRVCGDTGCLPLPATTVLACGKEGYIACGLENGGMLLNSRLSSSTYMIFRRMLSKQPYLWSQWLHTFTRSCVKPHLRPQFIPLPSSFQLRLLCIRYGLWD